MNYKEITDCCSVPVYEKAEAAPGLEIFKYLGLGES